MSLAESCNVVMFISNCDHNNVAKLILPILATLLMYSKNTVDATIHSEANTKKRTNKETSTSLPINIRFDQQWTLTSLLKFPGDIRSGKNNIHFDDLLSCLNEHEISDENE